MTFDNYKDVCKVYYNKNDALAENKVWQWSIAGEDDVDMYPECVILNKTSPDDHNLENLCNNYLEKLDD